MAKAQLSLLDPEMSAAGISPCGKYRYWLTRTWDRQKSPVCFVMLNPSTADAHQDDPTIRRCMGFAKAWGHGGIVVVNLFAYRATDPKTLPTSTPRHEVEANNHAIQTAAFNRLVIASWGANSKINGRDREVIMVLKGQDVRCLGTTKEGYPRHPLYVSGNVSPVPYAIQH